MADNNAPIIGPVGSGFKNGLPLEGMGNQGPHEIKVLENTKNIYQFNANEDVEWELLEVENFVKSGTYINDFANTNLSSQIGTTSLGTPSASISISVSLSGVAATSSVGTVTQKSSNRVSVAGIAATGSPGLPTFIGKANISVVGVQSIGSVGTVLVWSDVDQSQSSNFNQTTNTQTPSWSGTNEDQSSNFSQTTSTQTPSWSDVNDSETPSWEEVA